MQRGAERVSILTALLLAGCAGGHDGTGTARPTPGPSLQITGAVNTPASFTAAQLAALPAISQTVSFTSGTGAQTHSYTGTSLWSLLNGAGIQTDPAHKSDLTGRFVVATGSDGYRAVFSLGELSPDFGNRQSIVAYASTDGGSTAPLPAADGPFRVTAPRDIKGGRYVSNLARLEVRSSGASTSGIGGGVSTRLVVSGQVASTATFDINALKGLPAASATVGRNTYTGVSLWALLNTIGLKLPPVKNPSLSMYAVATGSDGFRALVSLGEVDPGFGNNGTLVAYQVNGAPLGANGDMRLIVPGEVKQGRSISNLIAIEVFSEGKP